MLVEPHGMNLRSEILKGSFVLTLGQLVSFLSSFLRNILLARLLTKADFGIASTFAIIISVFELVGKMAVGTLIIQAKDGDHPDFQATAHLVQFVAGVLGALLILIFAGPISTLFKVPEARWGFMWLAAIPLFKGLEHLDVNRMVRDMNFVPSVLIEAVPQVIVTIVAWHAALWLKDYRAMLLLLLLGRLLSLVVSHTLAIRPYKWAWHDGYARLIARFGGPLLINGFLMFCIFQGDRLVVGAGYSIEDLAAYSVAASLSLVPGLMVVQVVQGIALPLLSRTLNNPDEFRRRYDLCAQSLSLFSTLFATTMIIAGETLVRIYGKKYEGTGIILAWLACSQAFRIIRAAPTLAALSRGDSKNLMDSNFVRLFGVILAAIAANRGLPLHWVAAAGFVGELLAFVFATFRLSKLHQLDKAAILRPAAVTVIFMLVAGILAFAGVPNDGWAVVLSFSLLLSLGAICVFLRLFVDLRKLVMAEAILLTKHPQLKAHV